MDAAKFGAFIAETRRERGMTQAALAARLHVTDKAVSRWERGLGFPDISTIEPLAAALGVSVLELMRSERLPEGAVSSEEASEAVTQALDMAQQDKSSRFYNAFAVSACLLFGFVAMLLFHFRNWGWTVVFCLSVLTLVLCGRRCRQEENQALKVFLGAVCVLDYLLAVVSGLFAMPGPMFEQYAYLILALAFLPPCVQGLARLVQTVVNRPRAMSTGKFLRELLLHLAVLLIALHIFGRWADLAVSSRIDDKANAARQYAQALLQSDHNIRPDWVTGVDTGYHGVDRLSGQNIRDFYDFYELSFTCQLPGAKSPAVYRYTIGVSHDFTMQVFGQSGGPA